MADDLDDLSEYLLGSRTVTLLDEARRDFEQAGIPVGRGAAADAWNHLEGLVDQALRMLGVAHDVLGEQRLQREDHPATDPARGQVYQDGSSRHRWRLMGTNGEVVAAAAESFASRSNAEHAARAFVSGTGSWRYEIYRDNSGGFRWRAKASNGETVAVSPGSFVTMASAERAADYIRQVPTTFVHVT